MLDNLQREATVRDFLLQSFEDAGNTLISWAICSLVFFVLASVVLSNYVSVLPKFVDDAQLLGYQLNKYGFTFLSLLLFHLFKTLLTYLFYQSTGDGQRFNQLYFAATKYFFAISLLLPPLAVVQYFIKPGRAALFELYFAGAAGFILFKVLYYLFSRPAVLPEKGYYKILYICTLQIIPVLVLWKLLFF